MLNYEETFVERSGKEAGQLAQGAAEATARPFAVLYERIKPLLVREFSRKFIQPLTRPLMSPRRLRWA